jgi:hypothetical protein
VDEPGFRRLLSVVLTFVVLVGCEPKAPSAEGTPTAQNTKAEPAPPVPEPVRSRRPAPDRGRELRCEDLRPTPEEEQSLVPETIELLPPPAGKKIVMAKTEVIVTFSRDEYLKTARCLKLHRAAQYIEEETGYAEETPMYDAFQLSYVAAALLDAGRAGVRLRDETESRQSIVRDGWAADGCRGRCRSFGRLYRLSEHAPSFFLRITDKTRNDWE